jgi:hypothetical protein
VQSGKGEITMDGLTLFGLFAVTAMLASYALEAQPLVHPCLRGCLRAGFDLRISAGCLAVRLVEAIWAMVALRRFADRRAVDA